MKKDAIYANGAIVLTLVSDTYQTVVDPLVAAKAAQNLGIDTSIVPKAPTDRAVAQNAINNKSPSLKKIGHPLTALSGVKAPVIRYSVGRLEKTIDRADTEHLACAVFDSTAIDPKFVAENGGHHEVIDLLNAEYKRTRGKLAPTDWKSTVAQFVLRHLDGDNVFHAAYFVPKSRLDDLKKIVGYLAKYGVNLAVLEVADSADFANTAIVAQGATNNLGAEVAAMIEEAELFDGTQNGATYARRIEEYGKLRAKLGSYHDSLGIAVDDLAQSLLDLEHKANQMLDIRSTTPRRNVITGKAKVCGACGDSGHNVRTCPIVAKAKASLANVA